LHRSSSSGSTLLYTIAALVLLSSLAAAMAVLSPGAALTSLSGAREARAYYLALSGLNAWSVGRAGTYAVDGDSFTLAATGPDAGGLYTVTSRGTVQAGIGLEANAVVTARRSGLSPISFTQNLGDFDAPVVGKTANNAKAVTVYAANTGYQTTTSSHGHSQTTNVTDPYASGSLVFAKGTGDTTGAIWYAGSRGVCPGGVCPDGLCAAGRCGLGKGLRASFGFIFTSVDNSGDSTEFGDGFTFTIANAAGNDPATAAGGPASGSRGEYLGYAGPGPSGLGIAAPKLAVEVDVYPNRGTNPPDQVNSRHDNSNANHVALVWWGASGLYDDNVHGAGANPVIGTTTSGTGYSEKAKQNNQPNWLEDGQEHTMRVELERDDITGGGTYLVKVWIDATGAGAGDVTKDYTAQAPQLDYKTTLGSADHEALDTVIFGWTQATGGAVQTVAIHDFSLEFQH
jgi:hypothetical protein